jgi:hypothetical protein
MGESLTVSVSRTWLESLSTAELIKLADDYGIDIPHGLERIFIIEELLEYSDKNIQKIENDIEVDTSYPETAPLPKQYNISYIEVVIRDPLWVFVYWEIKGQDREMHENSGDFKGYCLRLVPLNGTETENSSKENLFTVAIDTEDSARYLGLAEHSSQEQKSYIIKLGVIRGEAEIHIAESQPFCLPKLIDNETINNMKKNPLLRLSGIQDFLIIKSTDRQPRIKRGQ